MEKNEEIIKPFKTIVLSIPALYKALKVQYGHSKMWSNNSEDFNFTNKVGELIDLMEKTFSEKELNRELKYNDYQIWR